MPQGRQPQSIIFYVVVSIGRSLLGEVVFSHKCLLNTNNLLPSPNYGRGMKTSPKRTSKPSSREGGLMVPNGDRVIPPVNSSKIYPPEWKTLTWWINCELESSELEEDTWSLETVMENMKAWKRDRFPPGVSPRGDTVSQRSCGCLLRGQCMEWVL